MQPATPEAYRLLHDGSLALAQCSHAGVRVDVPYLEKAIADLTQEISKLQNEATKDPIWKTWRHHYGEKANFDARDQLSHILFGVMGLESKKSTGGGEDRDGRAAADEEALERTELPFAQGYVRIQKRKKLRDTYLRGTLREVEGDLIHFNFWLHKVISYRSSAADPNFQNIPIRLPEIAAIIRRAFISRDGHRLVETDIKGAEVRAAAWYHKDPTMLEYIKTGYDMHKEMAARCFFLPVDLVPDELRQQVKGSFVFAEFYGSYYINVTEDLWDAIRRYKLTTKEGTSLYEHLAANGITGLGTLNPRERPRPGTFEEHIRNEERLFWEKRFPVYAQWKQDWFRQYMRRGWFDCFTGFVWHGVYSEKECTNYPVQGVSFHCLLWVLIRLVREMRRRRMRSLVVGQIHDSIVADVHDDEFDDYVELIRDITCRQLPAAWPFICTAMDMDVAASPVNGNWYEKKKVKVAA